MSTPTSRLYRAHQVEGDDRKHRVEMEQWARMVRLEKGLLAGLSWKRLAANEGLRGSSGLVYWLRRMRRRRQLGWRPGRYEGTWGERLRVYLSVCDQTPWDWKGEP